MKAVECLFRNVAPVTDVPTTQWPLARVYQQAMSTPKVWPYFDLQEDLLDGEFSLLLGGTMKEPVDVNSMLTKEMCHIRFSSSM